MIEENQIKLRIRRIRRESLETNMKSLKLEFARGGLRIIRLNQKNIVQSLTFNVVEEGSMNATTSKRPGIENNGENVAETI